MNAIDKLKADAIEELDEWLADNPGTDPGGELIDTIADGQVPDMVTTLFQMVVDDNSLAWLECEADVDRNASSTLYGAILEHIKEALYEHLRERAEFDQEGTNLVASALLDDDHDVVGVSEFGDETSDTCAVCSFGVGWVYPPEGGDRFGHATTATPDEVRRWISEKEQR